jgi:putative ABC transport system permease protein
MIRYNFKLAIRNLQRSKVFSLINITGLAVAIASVILIVIYIRFETNFDRHFSNWDSVARLTIEQNNGSYHSHFARISNPIIKEIPGNLPEVKTMARVAPYRNCSVKFNDQKFYSLGAYATDSNFFRVFNVPLIAGDAENILESESQAVISQSLVEKYFPNGSPIGEQIELGHQFEDSFSQFTIVGIMPDFPSQSHFHPEILVSFEDPSNFSGWNYVYLLLNSPDSHDAVTSKFESFLTSFGTEDDQKYRTLHLQPISDIHLKSHKDREIEANSDIKTIWILISLSILILLVAFINFTNLNMVMAQKQNKSIFINHILGGKLKSVLTISFWQNILIVGLATSVGILVAFSLFPAFKSFFHLPNINFSGNIGRYFVLAILFLVVVGSLIGLNPFFQKELRASLLSGSSHSSKNNSGRVLIMLQFFIVVLLFTASITIQKQMDLLMSNRLGGQTNNIINLYNLPRTVIDKYPNLKAELLSIAGVEAVSAGMEEPAGELMDTNEFELEGMTEEQKKDRIYLFPCDYDFCQFYNIEMLAGEALSADTSRHFYVVNETAAKFLGFNNPQEAIGKQFKLKFFLPGYFGQGIISGVCEDFHLTTLGAPEKPTVLYHNNTWNFCVGIKYTPEALASVLPQMNAKWDELFPDHALEYHFIDDFYQKGYRQYANQKRFLLMLSFLAILISSLGLFAVSLHSIQCRIKEIGIRKVNGARITEVISMLNKDFLKWVAIAFVIATPIAYYAMNKWLENFAYKTELSWWIFALAGLLALGIALLTVSWQSWRASTRNPVEALRYE